MQFNNPHVETQAESLWAASPPVSRGDNVQHPKQPEAQPLASTHEHHRAADSGALGFQPLTLRFIEWQCGHHHQRPADIQCTSVVQAHAILTAISCAISQPGSARAILFDATHGYAGISGGIYLTDDHVDPDFKPTTQLTDERPVLIYGDEATLAAIQAPSLQPAREQWYFAGDGVPDLDGLACWDDKSAVQAWDVLLTTRTPADVDGELMVALNAYLPRGYLFELPPLYVPAEKVLEKLLLLQADLATSQDEAASAPQAPSPHCP